MGQQVWKKAVVIEGSAKFVELKDLAWVEKCIKDWSQKVTIAGDGKQAILKLEVKMKEVEVCQIISDAIESRPFEKIRVTIEIPEGTGSKSQRQQ